MFAKWPAEENSVNQDARSTIDPVPVIESYEIVPCEASAVDKTIVTQDDDGNGVEEIAVTKITQAFSQKSEMYSNINTRRVSTRVMHVPSHLDDYVLSK